MRPPSIRRALLFRCGIGVGVLLCFLSASIYLLVRQSSYREADRSITQTAALLANQVELGHGGVTFEWQEGLGTNEALILEGLFQFWDERTGHTTRSPALQAHDLPRFHGAQGSPLVKSIVLPNGDRGRAVGLQVLPFVLPEESERMRSRGELIDPKSLPHTLVVAGSIEPEHHTLARLRYALASGVLLALALGFTLIDHVIRISLRPIDKLAREMHERAEHQLDCSLSLPREMPAELTGLAQNFDSLLARVAITRHRERDFIRHAAHELRTPIAGLRATIELALSQARDATSYAGYLTTCRAAADELGGLVTRLSALARIGTSAAAPEVLEVLDPHLLVTECLSPFLSTIELRHIHAVIEPAAPDLRFIGERTLSRIILNNLLDNAACYTPDNAVIRIRCERAGSQVQIIVSNPAADLTEDPARLFEPLFRRDSPLHDTGTHLGIGLTLSLDAASAMGGTLHACKTAAGWIEFIFGLPGATA
jgi:signal transduction histidine kinase